MCIHAMLYVLWSENILHGSQELVFSFYQTQVFRIGGKRLYPLKHPALTGQFLSQQIPWWLPTRLRDLEEAPDTCVFSVLLGNPLCRRAGGPVLGKTAAGVE